MILRVGLGSRLGGMWLRASLYKLHIGTVRLRPGYRVCLMNDGVDAVQLKTLLGVRVGVRLGLQRLELESLTFGLIHKLGLG